MPSFSIELDVRENLFLRNPQRSPLGRKILQHSILLIDEIGLERFTFKKLAERIGSAEASIYRYFENKHLLLLYLINWYWEWMKFRIDFKTMNVEDPKERLNIVISAIVDTAKRNTHVEFIDEDILHRIVVTEGTKAYHNKEVDELNREGFFLSYKSLCEKIAGIILEIQAEFPYPRALASSLLEMANNHIYFAEHLPRLTDVEAARGQVLLQVESLLRFFAFNLLKKAEDGAAVDELLEGMSNRKSGKKQAGSLNNNQSKNGTNGAHFL